MTIGGLFKISNIGTLSTVTFYIIYIYIMTSHLRKIANSSCNITAYMCMYILVYVYIYIFCDVAAVCFH